MKVDLSNLGKSFILFICKEENEKALLSDWFQMLTEHPVLCDLQSNVRHATDKALSSIENLDAQGMVAWGQPSPVSGIDRYIIFVCKKYFATDEFNIRKAILLHELGHFYVYQTKMLGQLRKDWKRGEDLFRAFIVLLEKEDEEWVKKIKNWIKSFYDDYIFDLLKIPGEYFANLWVKEGFKDIFPFILERFYQEYKTFFNKVFTNVPKKLAKFPLFSLSLRLRALLILIDDSPELGRFEELRGSCWTELEKLTTGPELDLFKEFDEEIIKFSSSLKTANELLVNALDKYIRSFPVSPNDLKS